MGKLERQIMIGALALVGILVAIVILKGLAPRGEGEGSGTELLGSGAPLILDGSSPVVLDPQVGLTPDPALDPKLDPAAVPPTPALEPWIDLAVMNGSSNPSALTSGTEQLPLQPSLEPLPAAPPAVPVVKDSYTIKKNDTLGHIAQRELGSARRVKEIMDLNPGLNPNSLVPGTVIKLPQGGVVEVKREAAAPVAADGQFHMHTVVAGDSLWALAARYLSDGNRFRDIVAANPGVLKGENSVLPLGAKLRIPKQ